MPRALLLSLKSPRLWKVTKKPAPTAVRDVGAFFPIRHRISVFKDEGSNLINNYSVIILIFKDISPLPPPEASQVRRFLTTAHLLAVSVRTAAHQVEDGPRETLHSSGVHLQHQQGRQARHEQPQLLVADTTNLGME